MVVRLPDEMQDPQLNLNFRQTIKDERKYAPCNICDIFMLKNYLLVNQRAHVLLSLINIHKFPPRVKAHLPLLLASCTGGHVCTNSEFLPICQARSSVTVLFTSPLLELWVTWGISCVFRSRWIFFTENFLFRPFVAASLFSLHWYSDLQLFWLWEIIPLFLVWGIRFFSNFVTYILVWGGA